MKFTYDHDLHIHSQISLCSDDPDQTPDDILKYAKDNNLNTIVVTDHYWDEKASEAEDIFYKLQGFERISKSRPLPQAEGIRFLFGCETEMDRNFNIGIVPERYDEFDFIIVPTTHYHIDCTVHKEEMASLEGRARTWCSKFEALLNKDLPFHKTGFAHLICSSIGRDDTDKVMDLIPDEEYKRLFTIAAKKGLGIELNSFDIEDTLTHNEKSLFRPFAIAKECGCKFYLGTDSHHPADFPRAKALFERAIDYLGLEESDKFILK